MRRQRKTVHEDEEEAAVCKILNVDLKLVQGCLLLDAELNHSLAGHGLDLRFGRVWEEHGAHVTDRVLADVDVAVRGHSRDLKYEQFGHAKSLEVRLQHAHVVLLPVENVERTEADPNIHKIKQSASDTHCLQCHVDCGHERNCIASVVKQLAEWRRAARSPRLLSIACIKRLIYED